MSKGDKILIYKGVGNTDKVLVRGHYFTKYPIRKLSEKQGRIQNLLQAINRFRLHPYKNRQLNITLGEDIIQVVTGSDGYFESVLDHISSSPGWHQFKVHDPQTDLEEEGSYFVPDETSPSVISDVDDTLLISHSTKFLRKMRLILFKNAHTRKATKSLFTQDWTKNLLPESDIDSYFYVSSSEWNLYDFLTDFFEVKGLPTGPFFLKHLKTSPLKLLKSGAGHHDHKFRSIEFILDFFPRKQFYLLGDSGQKDVHIYMDVAKDYPERIKGVLIRKIKRSSRKKVLREAEELFQNLDIPFHAFSDKEIDQITFDTT